MDGRYEKKYIINEYEYNILKNKISNFMKRDIHTNNGYYDVYSIYFDDYEYTSYNDSLDGVYHKEKYRIRFYSDGNYKLEIKEKKGDICYKSIYLINEGAFINMLNGNYRLIKNINNKIQEKWYRKLTHDLYRPRILIYYKREAYEDKKSKVRVNFDFNIKYTANIKSKSSLKVLNRDIIFEVKYNSVIPEYLLKIFNELDKNNIGYSKYAKAIGKIIEY
ncbi:MAG: polyphosphate polymerase domain-containing protein [bacterium]|nr:polyphosphate polymerase domain-containing protein [bacterium]